MDAIYKATVTAPVNIATLKYWGKRDVALNLPTNSSISVTLSQNDLRTTTTASASLLYTEDELYLNGSKEDVSSKRIQTLFRELRALRKAEEDKQTGSLVPLSKYYLRIVSENNFPTAAGLASSAAGFAALVKAVAELYQLPQSNEELSILARQGSGSACRSLFGGYVAWEMGSKADGSDSKAVQIAPYEHWPEMKAAILVVSAERKDTPSTSGMQLTVKTSSLFKERVNSVVPQRFEQMKKSILEKDFETFAHLTMADSNQFHATCLDSYPPIFYLNDVSRAAIRLVEDINKVAGEVVAAYTFDAGPNAVIYYLAQNEQLVLGPLRAALKNLPAWKEESHSHIQELMSDDFDKRWVNTLHSGIERIILTGVGQGPQLSTNSLIDKNGNLWGSSF
ncbi:diphosphomevalonate decarboxylase MVD1 [Sugiyamaella lignohabitans]|uniref:Diphosphomevalonate decarboxylase n=1 Tax=Sugiyamaella lignohabitans TaxID=796027 RepID=A0A167F945_9ASCO|nr:diphosphomevalonate decarboxylase MVD1 [Sugiyamaella lignohabitans]ANB14982.1 diphosphomevalonate decarboxylase MVD1 [Sugiyamaella lignohabitans]